MRRLALDFGYDGTLDRPLALERARIADDLGVEALFVAETFGLDAFVVMTQLAGQTKRARIGSFIVSIFARSAAATAQGFISLDIASEGRAIAGIGVGTAQMARGWHGAIWGNPLGRLRDYTEVMRMVFDGQPLHHEGATFRVEALGIAARERPVQERLPIGIGAIIPAAVRLTAEAGDYWFAQATPISDVPFLIADFRRLVAAAGRPTDAVQVKSPGLTIAATSRIDELRLARARYNAYAFRHLKSLHRQLERFGKGALVPQLQAAWQSGGSRQAAHVFLDAIGDEIDFVGTPEACVERLERQAAAGVDLHGVQVEAADSREYAAIMKTLLG